MKYEMDKAQMEMNGEQPEMEEKKESMEAEEAEMDKGMHGDDDPEMDKGMHGDDDPEMDKGLHKMYDAEVMGMQHAMLQTITGHMGYMKGSYQYKGLPNDFMAINGHLREMATKGGVYQYDMAAPEKEEK